MNAAAVYPFLMSLAAGLSTAVGGLLVVFAKKKNTAFLSFSLGFAAGVMVTVSLADLMPEAQRLIDVNGSKLLSGLCAVCAMLLGMLFASVIERFVPENPSATAVSMVNAGRGSLTRVGIVTAIAIVLHNLPEGIATYMAGCRDIGLGISISLAIALHNIPEGISISVPIYYGTGSKAKAIGYALVSGLSEPIGALLAMAVLKPFLSDRVLGATFGAIAGIMIYIAFSELIPASRRYRRTGCSLLGILAGIAVMTVGLIII